MAPVFTAWGYRRCSGIKIPKRVGGPSDIGIGVHHAANRCLICQGIQMQTPHAPANRAPPSADSRRPRVGRRATAPLPKWLRGWWPQTPIRPCNPRCRPSSPNGPGAPTDCSRSTSPRSRTLSSLSGGTCSFGRTSRTSSTIPIMGFRTLTSAIPRWERFRAKPSMRELFNWVRN